MAIEVFLGIEGSAFGLFEEDELCLEVAIVLVVNDWPLEGQSHSSHEGFCIGSQVAVVRCLCEHPLCFLLPLFPLLLLTLLWTIKDLQV